MKTNPFKLIALLLSLSVISLSGIALQPHLQQTVKKENELNSLLFENNQLIITLHLEETPTKVYGIISILNKTTENLLLTYNKLAYYNGQCLNQNSPENTNSVQIPAKSMVAGSSIENTDGLRVFHSFKSGGSSKKLTALTLVNIQIEKI